MSTDHTERRGARSDNPHEALRHQLAHTCKKGGLDALVLTNDEGLGLAAAGRDEVCDELGAFAPLIGRSVARVRLPRPLRKRAVAVRPIAVHGAELYLASAGGGVARDALLAHSASGVRRILTDN